jgi:hypothetical protein
VETKIETCTAVCRTLQIQGTGRLGLALVHSTGARVLRAMCHADPEGKNFLRVSVKGVAVR